MRCNLFTSFNYCIELLEILNWSMYNMINKYNINLDLLTVALEREQRKHETITICYCHNMCQTQQLKFVYVIIGKASNKNIWCNIIHHVHNKRLGETCHFWVKYDHITFCADRLQPKQEGHVPLSLPADLQMQHMLQWSGATRKSAEPKQRLETVPGSAVLSPDDAGLGCEPYGRVRGRAGVSALSSQRGNWGSW